MSISDDLKKAGSFILKKGKDLGSLTKLKIEIWLFYVNPLTNLFESGEVKKWK